MNRDRNMESDIVQGLIDLAHQGVNIGDFARRANWGVYKGRPVIVDAGFSDYVWNNFYSPSRRR